MDFNKPHVHYRKESNGDWKVTVVVFVNGNKTLTKGADSGTVVDVTRVFELTEGTGTNPDPHQEEHVFTVKANIVNESAAKVIVKDNKGPIGVSHTTVAEFDQI